MTHYRIAELPAEERPLNRLREVGAHYLSTTELLACVLQTGDALHQAQTLLTTLGGLEGLARAEMCMFADVPGIGAARAAQVQAALELGRRAAFEHGEELVQVRAPSDAGNVLLGMSQHQEQEHFMVLYLDTRNRIVDREVLYRGTLNQSLVRTAEIFRGAIRRNVMGIILGHNHPSGDPEPSAEDIALTRNLVEAGKLMQIDVLDHIVVGRGRWVSLRERGLGFEGVR